jgi:hypothetical protein
MVSVGIIGVEDNHHKGDRMARKEILSAVLLSLFSATLSAAPEIAFDTKTFHCDTVVEEKTEILKAVFNVKNTGDALLKIENVRPGCGCTNVKFDSTIKPGKSVKISAEVNIKGYKAGTVSKTLTVTSNAENEKDVRLTISATIVAVIELSDHALSFGGSDTSKTRTVTVASKKHDLNVSEVFLKQGDASPALDWKNELRMQVVFKWRPLDSIRADGARIFKLDLTPPVVATSFSGEMAIKTNHPEKPELKIQAYCAVK